VDHVWHAMFFKHPDERARYIKSQNPNADTDHLLKKYKKFPKIYRDDIVEFAVIANGKIIKDIKTRQEAHALAEKQQGYVVVVDVPISEKNHPRYDQYYQEIIKTPLVPSTQAVVEKQSIPVVEEEQSIPVVEEEQSIPVVEEEQTIPVVEEEQSIPVVEEEQTIPVVEEEQTIPVVEEEQTIPVVKEEQSIPVVEEEQTTPIVEEEQTTPIVEEEQTIPIVEETPSVVV